MARNEGTLCGIVSMLCLLSIGLFVAGACVYTLVYTPQVLANAAWQSSSCLVLSSSSSYNRCGYTAQFTVMVVECPTKSVVNQTRTFTYAQCEPDTNTATATLNSYPIGSTVSCVVDPANFPDASSNYAVQFGAFENNGALFGGSIAMIVLGVIFTLAMTYWVVWLTKREDTGMAEHVGHQCWKCFHKVC